MKLILSTLAAACVLANAALAAETMDKKMAAMPNAAGMDQKMVMGPRTAVSSEEQRLIDIEKAIAGAMIRKDFAAAGRYIGDDWVSQDESGKPTTKASLFKDLKSGKLVITSMTIHDAKVRFFGDTAVVQAMDDETSTYAGKDGSGTYSWTDVFVKRYGQWVSVASQLSRVKT